MNNKKVFLVIFLAAILALLVASLFIPKKSENTDLVKEDAIIENINTVQVEEKTTFSDVDQNVVEQIQAPKQETIKQVSKNYVKKDEPIFEKLQIYEPVKVEQAGVSFDDVGILNDNGAIVVTRTFKAKSPDKYSFVGFGVQKAPVK